MNSLSKISENHLPVEDDVCEIEHTAPQLRLLWELIGPERVRSTPGYRSQEVLKTLKRVALENGLMPSAWRFLCRLDEPGVRVILGGRGFHLSKRLEYANYFAKVGVRPCLDRWFGAFIVLYRLITAGESVNERKLHAFTREAFRESWNRRESMELFTDELMYVAEWFVYSQAEIEGGGYSKSQFRAPWSWWLYQAEKYNMREYKLPPQIKDVSWRSLLGPFIHQGYEIVPLTSARELYWESEDLRHCVYSYVKHCRSGMSRIFSVRRKEEPCATFEIAFRDENWVLVQVRSCKNRRPDDGAIYVARETLRRYRNMWGETL